MADLQPPLALLPSPEVVSPSLPTLPKAQVSPALVYLARLSSPMSRETMRKALTSVSEALLPGVAIEVFPWHSLRYEHTQAIRALLVERLSPASVNKTLSALRGVLKEAFRLSLMSAEDYMRASSIEGAKNRALPAGRALETAEVASLFEAMAGEDPLSQRDRAIFGLLFTIGLRRSEVVSLDLEDYVNGTLKVRGKGEKERLCYVTNEARSLLEAWLKVRGSDQGPLFYPARKGGKLEARRMTDQAVYNIVTQRQAKANLAPFSPHDARRTFISNAIEASKDLVAVQHLAGHANVNTTARYDRRNEAPKKRVAALLHLPIPSPSEGLETPSRFPSLPQARP